MKIINKLILATFASLSISFLACKNDEKKAETELKQEIMAVHDDVMPKMADLNRLKQRLDTYKDAVSDDNVELKDSLINSILLLSKMEDNMMDWMGTFKMSDPEAKHEDRMIYLKGQRDSVKMMSDEIYMSLAIAKGLLKNTPDTTK